MTKYKNTPEGTIPLNAEEEEFERLQIEEWVKSVQFNQANSYKYARAAEYPDFRDYLDGIVKGDQAQVQAYIDACLAVKAKYPKP